MEKDKSTRTETDQHADPHAETVTERTAPAEKRESGPGGIAKRTYEEAIDKAVKDVH